MAVCMEERSPEREDKIKAIFAKYGSPIVKSLLI
jgi:hypothetical protein